MKITPLEIRQKSFEKKIRGYDKDEVNAFLLSLSQEWERMIDAHKELKYRLEVSENEVNKLREVESSLFKTLKTAEDTGANMIQQANKTAELHLRETQMNADSILNEAKAKAKKMLEDANSKSNKTLEEMGIKLQELFQQYKSLERQQENLASEINHIANDSLDKVKKIASKSESIDIDSIMAKINTNSDQKNATSEDEPKDSNPNPEVVKEVSEKRKKKKESSSFFDEIE
jgi:cell division initiation protein